MPSHRTRHADYRRARDEAIVEALVVPFSVIVRHVLGHRAPEMPISDRNQPVQTLKGAEIRILPRSATPQIQQSCA
jgi:hypothetical protein